MDEEIKIELQDCAHMTRLDVFGEEGGRNLEGPKVLSGLRIVSANNQYRVTVARDKGKSNIQSPVECAYSIRLS